MALSFTAAPFDFGAVSTPMLAIALRQGRVLPDVLKPLDDRLGGALTQALGSGDFAGRRDETLQLTGPGDGVRRLLLVGMGEPPLPGSGPALKRAAAIAARQAGRWGIAELSFAAPDIDDALLEHAVAGIGAGAWRYDDLQTPLPVNERKAPLVQATVLATDAEAAGEAVARGAALSHGQALARRLAMMPGNVCTPQLLAETARDIAERHGLAVEVLGRDEMEAEGMGAFLAVAQGTPQEPQLIVLRYEGGSGKPVVLVGKGLCFDTGGISIKPAEKMELMKFDMSGAAGVLGAMETVARLQPNANVIGVIGATTNMPSGTAVKPGDVVRSSLGKTIEVINTDAEGRMVLADLLAYVRRFDPAAVIDAATLTGACVIALGHVAMAVFGADEPLVQEVLDAGRRAGEPGWAMPLWDEYREQIKSDVADIRNSGGRAAGSITAALFLKEFVSYPWVHLDIAGTAYSESDLVALPKGPTGVPVGTMVEFVRGRSA